MNEESRAPKSTYFCFHLYKVKELAKLVSAIRSQVVGGGMRGLLDADNVLFLNPVLVTSVLIDCENAFSCI